MMVNLFKKRTVEAQKLYDTRLAFERFFSTRKDPKHSIAISSGKTTSGVNSGTDGVAVGFTVCVGFDVGFEVGFDVGLVVCVGLEVGEGFAVGVGVEAGASSVIITEWVLWLYSIVIIQASFCEYE